MRFEYRITKYNPNFRDVNGFYQKNYWILFSDIGRKFEGKNLSLSQYTKVEDAYVNSILLIMDECEIDSLAIIKIESDNTHCKIKIGDRLKGKRLDSTIRNTLRDNIWVKLSCPRRAFVHFGWDYYMYAGVSRPIQNSLKEIDKMGLFHEAFESPYK